MAMGRNRSRAQWTWDTMDLEHNGPGTQWTWDTMDLGHNGPGTQWTWDTMTWDTMDLGHNGPGTQWTWDTMGQKCTYAISFTFTYPIVWLISGYFTTNFLHSSRFSAFRSVMLHSRPIHSLNLSFHRYLYLPFRLSPCIVPCRTVLASADDSVTYPYHLSLHLFN